VLTGNAADYLGQAPTLLVAIEGKIASVAADGACDGEPMYQAVAGHQPDPSLEGVIPPRASAVLSTRSAEAQSQRDCHIRMIAEKGRMPWQREAGYGHRSPAGRRSATTRRSSGRSCAPA
jgi:hypothetical protein